MNQPDNIRQPDLCVPVQPNSLKELRRFIKEAKNAGATMVEVWLDALPPKERDIEEIRGMTNLKLLGVCKGAKEKGSFQGSEEERMAVLQDCIIYGFDMVDVGVETTSKQNIQRILKLAKTYEETKVSVSYHFFDKKGKSQKSLQKVLARMKKLKPDIYKIAVHAKAPSQVQTLLDINEGLRAEGNSAIILPMGDWSWFRMLAAELGAPLTFTAIDKERATAPGQITITEYQKARQEIESQGAEAPSLSNVPQELRPRVELLLKKPQQS